MAALTHLVGNPDLAKGRLLQRQLDDDRLDLGRRAVRQQRLASRELLKGDFAADLIQLLEAVEAVCFASSSRPTLARMTFCSFVIVGVLSNAEAHASAKTPSVRLSIKYIRARPAP